MVWGLFNHGVLVDECSYVFGFFIGSLRDDFHSRISIFNIDDVLSGCFNTNLVSFDCVSRSLRSQKRFLDGHPWECNKTLWRCVDLVLSSCSSWRDFLSIPNNMLQGVDLWFFSHPYFYVYYVFLVPSATATDNEHFLCGFDFLKRVSDYENEFYDYRPFDFSDLEIRPISKN